MNESVHFNGTVPIEDGFLTAWENPRPNVTIENLDFVTSSNAVIPFLF